VISGLHRSRTLGHSKVVLPSLCGSRQAVERSDYSQSRFSSTREAVAPRGPSPLKFGRGVLCVVQSQGLEFKGRFSKESRGTTHISIFCVVTALRATGEGLLRVNISVQR
jgi:hypothetical protein